MLSSDDIPGKKYAKLASGPTRVTGSEAVRNPIVREMESIGMFDANTVVKRGNRDRRITKHVEPCRNRVCPVWLKLVYCIHTHSMYVHLARKPSVAGCRPSSAATTGKNGQWWATVGR